MRFLLPTDEKSEAADGESEEIPEGEGIKLDFPTSEEEAEASKEKKRTTKEEPPNEDPLELDSTVPGAQNKKNIEL